MLAWRAGCARVVARSSCGALAQLGGDRRRTTARASTPPRARAPAAGLRPARQMSTIAAASAAGTSAGSTRRAACDEQAHGVERLETVGVLGLRIGQAVDAAAGPPAATAEPHARRDDDLQAGQAAQQAVERRRGGVSCSKLSSTSSIRRCAQPVDQLRRPGRAPRLPFHADLAREPRADVVGRRDVLERDEHGAVRVKRGASSASARRRKARLADAARPDEVHAAGSRRARAARAMRCNSTVRPTKSRRRATAWPPPPAATPATAVVPSPSCSALQFRAGREAEVRREATGERRYAWRARALWPARASDVMCARSAASSRGSDSSRRADRSMPSAGSRSPPSRASAAPRQAARRRSRSKPSQLCHASLAASSKPASSSPVRSASASAVR